MNNLTRRTMFSTLAAPLVSAPVAVAAATSAEPTSEALSLARELMRLRMEFEDFRPRYHAAAEAYGIAYGEFPGSLDAAGIDAIEAYLERTIPAEFRADMARNDALSDAICTLEERILALPGGSLETAMALAIGVLGQAGMDLGDYTDDLDWNLKFIHRLARTLNELTGMDRTGA